MASFFPGLDRLQAQADLMRAQAQAEAFKQKQFAAEQQGKGYFGDAMMGVYGNAPVGGGYPMPPQPGEASQPADYSGFQKPGPAYGGPQGLGTGSGGEPPPPSQVAMQGLPQTKPDIPAQGGQPRPAAQGQPQQGQVTIQQVVAAIKQKHPDADPVAVAEALNYFLPFLTEQDKSAWNNASAENKLQIAQMLEGGRNKRADQRVEAQNWRAGLQNDAKMNQLKKQSDYWDSQIKIAQQRQDARLLQEARLQQTAAAQAAYQYAISMANTDFMGDEDMKAQVQQQLKQEFGAAQQGLDDLPDAVQGSGNTDRRAKSGDMGVLNLKKKVAPVTPGGRTYNPETMRME